MTVTTHQTNDHGELSEAELSRIIEMAWEDRTPFEAIQAQYGMSQKQVIVLMRRELKPGAFKNWRQRTQGRDTKHLHKRPASVIRGYCPTQYKQR